MSGIDDASWPFDQPRNCAVVTQRSIVFGGAAILLVTHEEENHSWQFLTGGVFRMADAALVGLEEIVRGDPTVVEVSDLPPGWRAWREAKGSPWQRGVVPVDDVKS